MTYNECIRAIAEEMARENEPAIFSVANQFPDMPESVEAIKRVTDSYIDISIITVKHMADAVMAALSQKEWDPNNISTINKVRKYLSDQGLIPEKI